MTFISFLKMYLITVPIFFAIDLLWLGVIAKGVYQKYIGHLMRETPNWPVAIVFYLLFIVGMIIFVINPAIQKDSWTYALAYGAMFGFFTYMTFDLTNWAVLKDWPWEIVIIDIIWGTSLSAIVSLVSFFAIRNFIN
ncbi:DUF2177 domain-containing protein [Candidatus Parcubacteria bacterium]|nr:MAG: DUF2177 domain-containing protein [Candidatus Parcubacteria bacterium]